MSILLERIYWACKRSWYWQWRKWISFMQIRWGISWILACWRRIQIRRWWMVWWKWWETKKEKEIARIKTSSSSTSSSFTPITSARSADTHLHRREWQQCNSPNANSHYCKLSRNSFRWWPFLNHQPNFRATSKHTFLEYSYVNIEWTLVQYTNLVKCWDGWRDSSGNCHHGSYSS